MKRNLFLMLMLSAFCLVTLPACDQAEEEEPYQEEPLTSPEEESVQDAQGPFDDDEIENEAVDTEEGAVEAEENVVEEEGEENL